MWLNVHRLKTYICLSYGIFRNVQGFKRKRFDQTDAKYCLREADHKYESTEREHSVARSSFKMDSLQMSLFLGRRAAQKKRKHFNQRK